ncbi:MAG: hypothetical protein R3C44_23770 [Chloroflexota bacterium]
MPRMLNGRARPIFWVAVAGLLVAAAAWLLLPQAMAALPGQVRQYLPAGLAAPTPPPLPTLGPTVELALNIVPTAVHPRLSQPLR